MSWIGAGKEDGGSPSFDQRYLVGEQAQRSIKVHRGRLRIADRTGSPGKGGVGTYKGHRGEKRRERQHLPLLSRLARSRKLVPRSPVPEQPGLGWVGQGYLPRRSANVTTEREPAGAVQPLELLPCFPRGPGTHAPTLLCPIPPSPLCERTHADRRELMEKIRPLLRATAAIPSLAQRGDSLASLTLFPYLLDALRHAGPQLQASLQGRVAGSTTRHHT